MDENIDKVKPYQRLQAVLSDGKFSKDLKLTDRGLSIIDDILDGGIEKETFWIKIKSFFLKIDSKIFVKQKIVNNFQKR
jgi:hypothetical protein